MPDSTKEGEQREKFAKFIEVFTNCIRRDSRYFLSEIVNDPAVLVVIANSGQFLNYLSPGFKENLHVLEIKKPASCSRSHVRYFELMPGFKQSRMFGYIYDRMSEPNVYLASRGLNVNFLRNVTEHQLF